MNTVTISDTQLNVMFTVMRGGKLFYFEGERPEVSFEDHDGDNIPIRMNTFKRLKSLGLIEVIQRPAIGVELYGLTEAGFNLKM